ncbi:MAG: inorganic diphosphatase [Bacteroidia bacterium]|nr:inorganic diphosphatase [Bacteroidia bacterium]MBT8279212.1 inorganic diphosphatase [Bacteroidia bacterium]NND25722.1 inorganic diphosphatase [Flavobacteriaceae bacterium]NNK59748.1 inorganic diphosphatase [Flavobacteriaceae bacterium]
MKAFNKAILAGTVLVLLSCKDTINHYKTPAFSKDNILHAVVEIPAGTNKKYEFNVQSQSFEIDKKNGKERRIDFLPYVGNYGFIPSTFSDPKQGGDGDALDVLILSESLPIGSLVEIIPIGMLKLIDNGELDYKIIANLANVNTQVMKAKNFDELSKNYPEIMTIIELWFTNYNSDDVTKIEGWADETEALIEINNNIVK